MTFSHPPLRTTVLLAVAALSLVACKPWLTNAQTRGLSKLYFKAMDVFVRSEWTGMPAEATAVTRFETTLRTYRTVGFFTRTVPGAAAAGAPAGSGTPARVFSFVEPVLTVATTSTLDIPEALTTTEPQLGPTGALTPVRVSRQPLFQLRQLRVKWDVPGVSPPPDQTVEIQTDMRTASQVLPRIPITHPSEVIRQVQEASAASLGLRGVMTVTLLARDLDPLVAEDQREITVTRTIPVLFASGSVLMAEALATGSPLPLGGSIGGNSAVEPATPAPTSEPAPSPGASASPAATATVTP